MGGWKFLVKFLKKGLPSALRLRYRQTRLLKRFRRWTMVTDGRKNNNMKKILLALMILACAASMASATDGVQILWTTMWGAYTHDAPNVTDDPSDHFLLDSYALTWQLIYSVDATADAPNLGNNAGGWVSGDDAVWATRTFTMGDGSASDGTEWSTALYYASGDRNYYDTEWMTAGYIYQRAYEGAPAAGSWYFETAPVALVINPTTWQTSIIDSPSAGFQPNQQFSAIPEPATMSLLGLGALVVALRRRRA